MLVPPPHHMEFVEAYAHKGHVEDVLYAAPWLLGLLLINALLMSHSDTPLCLSVVTLYCALTLQYSSYRNMHVSTLESLSRVKCLYRRCP